MKASKRKRKPGRPPEGEKGSRVRDYPQLSMRVPRRVYREFTQLAKQTKRSNAELLASLLAWGTDRARVFR